MTLTFNKRVGKTIAKGQITVPKEEDTILDKQNYCPLRASVDITYILPNGFQIPGRLYQSENNTTTYYQFYIIKPNDQKKFMEQIKNYRILNFKFILTSYCLYVKPM